MDHKYVLALSHPFDPHAEGAQVPDQYSFPSSTSYMRTSFTIQVAANQTNCDFVVQPNLLATIAAHKALGDDAISGGVVNYDGAGGTWSEHAITNTATLSGTYTRYRIVGGGVRIRPLLSPLNQSGKILCAKVPSQPQIMATFGTGGGVLVTGSLWQNYLDFYGLPNVDSSGFVTSTILSQPSSHENMVSGCTMDGGLEVDFSICSGRAYNWRDAANTTRINSVTNAYQFDTFQSAAATGASPLNAYDGQFLENGGWSCLCFRATGLPSQSEAYSGFDVEIIFHVEGIIPVGLSATPNSSGQTPPVNMHLLNAAVHAAAVEPHFAPINHKEGRGVMQTLDNAAKAIGFGSFGHAVQSVPWAKVGKYAGEALGLAAMF